MGPGGISLSVLGPFTESVTTRRKEMKRGRNVDDGGPVERARGQKPVEVRCKRYIAFRCVSAWRWH